MRIGALSLFADLLLLAAAPVSGQAPRALTAEDYALAERFLGTTTVPLVTGSVGRPTWLADGRLWYVTSATRGYAFVIVDPARRTRERLFDQSRLAASLAAASATAVDSTRLPLQGCLLYTSPSPRDS